MRTRPTAMPVVLFNPAVSSVNMGDHIIADSARRHLAPVLQGRYVVDVSTHLPLSWNFMRLMRTSPLKLVLGSNLLRGRMNGLFRQWDVTPKSAPLARGSVLMGAGWWQYGDDPNRYTSLLYRYVLHPGMLHSVRDDYTKRMLENAGIPNVLVTGCPSLWSLTPQHTASIPTTPGSTVISTITDYGRHPESDRAMLDALSQRYERVRVWMQGTRDPGYLAELCQGDRVEVIDPSLAAFDEALDEPDVDYVGTRLHAGIRALQKGRRACIIAIDNRAREMSRSFGLQVVDRGNLTEIHRWVDESPRVSLDLPWDRISCWLDQFDVGL